MKILTSVVSLQLISMVRGGLKFHRS